MWAGRFFAHYPAGDIERGVLTSMALHMSHARPAHPITASVERLAGMAGVGTTRCREAMRTLELEGWIVSLDAKKGGRGSGGSSYRMGIEMLERHPDRSKRKGNATRRVSNAETPRAALPSDAQRQRNGPAKGNGIDQIKATPGVAEQGKYLTREREQGRDDARGDASPDITPSLSSPQKEGGVPQPLPADLELPADLVARVRSARPDLDDAAIALSVATFKAHHRLGAKHSLDAWLAKVETWLLRERSSGAAPAQRQGDTTHNDALRELARVHDDHLGAWGERRGHPARRGEDYGPYRQRLIAILSREPEAAAAPRDANSSRGPLALADVLAVPRGRT